MVRALATTAALLMEWWTPTPADIDAGYALYYDDGLMAQVAANRGYISRPDEYDAWLQARGLVGAVSLLRQGDLGRKVWLDGPDGIEGPFLVVDCAQRVHYPARVARGTIVEVDRATARRWGMKGPVPVGVWFVDPALMLCKVPVPL